MPVIPFNPTNHNKKHIRENEPNKSVVIIENENTNAKNNVNDNVNNSTNENNVNNSANENNVKNSANDNVKNNKNNHKNNKKGATHRKKLKFNIRKQTKRVKFNLSGNSIKKYHCPEMQPKWVAKIESGETLEGDFKAKRVPSITLKDLFA